MKFYLLMVFSIYTSNALAQSKVPLSSKIEELLKKKKKKRDQEEINVEKIKIDALSKRLSEKEEKELIQKQQQSLLEANKTRFKPKIPFLNFRPTNRSALWKFDLSYALDTFENSEELLQKKIKETHLIAHNEFQYSMTKKLLIKYGLAFHIQSLTTNEKSFKGTNLSSDPPLKNTGFSDHHFEVNYRYFREIFYGFDLDYFFRIAYPLGEATRAYAFGDGSQSRSGSTQASQNGDLKSPFSLKPEIGIDYFSGKEKLRYNLGGSFAYALKGRYVLNKGTGFFASNPSGLIVKTDNFMEAKIWIKLQKRANLLKRGFWGVATYLHYIGEQKESFFTNIFEDDSFNWDQKDTIKAHARLSFEFWYKHMLKNTQHIKFYLLAFAPYSYTIKKDIVNEGADINGDREFRRFNFEEKRESINPVRLGLSFQSTF